MSETIIDKFKQAAAQIPREVTRFVIKGGLLLLGWCLLYGFILKPYNLVDPVLTKCTAKATIWIMRYLYHGQYVDVVYTLIGAQISIHNQEVLLLGDACNGLDLYVLFAGFIFCVPMGVKKMATYVLIGILGIFVLNVLRCIALVYLFYHHSGYADIAHHYFFQLIVYAAIFIVWERYFRSLKTSHERL